MKNSDTLGNNKCFQITYKKELSVDYIIQKATTVVHRQL